MGNDLYEEQLVIAIPHICRRMTGELGFAATLRCEKTERNQFSLCMIQTLSGVIIPKAIISQPQVDVSALLRP